MPKKTNKQKKYYWKNRDEILRKQRANYHKRKLKQMDLSDPDIARHYEPEERVETYEPDDEPVEWEEEDE